MNHEGTISTLLLLVVKHHQKKRKVVPQTDCWDILLKAKRRYNSWWPRIKLPCKMTWKRTWKWPFYFLHSGSTKWYFFQQSYATIEHWSIAEEKCARCKNKKVLCSDILQMWWIIVLEQKRKMFLRFPYSCLVLRYENFLNNFFLCSNKVIYMTNFVGQMIVWGFIL